VVKIMDFGAFVDFLGKRDGLAHVARSPPSASRTRRRGNVRLSMKVVDQETGREKVSESETAE